LGKQLEQAPLLFFGNANSRILDGESDPGTTGLYLNRCHAQDNAAGVGKFQRIANQIHQDLTKPHHTRFFPGDPDTSRAWTAEKHSIIAPYFLYVSRLEHPGKNHVRPATSEFGFISMEMKFKPNECARKKAVNCQA
jgi:hypothetical protein